MQLDRKQSILMVGLVFTGWLVSEIKIADGSFCLSISVEEILTNLGSETVEVIINTQMNI